MTHIGEAIEHCINTGALQIPPPFTNSGIWKYLINKHPEMGSGKFPNLGHQEIIGKNKQ